MFLDRQAHVLGCPPAPPDITAFLTVKDGATVEEYYDCFWTHAASKTLVVKGTTFEMEASRGEFVDEGRTTVYRNLKAPKELLLNCHSCDMATMGAMMGGEKFQAMGALLWDMDPAAGLKLRAPPPAADGAKADIICFLTVNEGSTVEEYCDLFWSHAEGTTLTCKGKTYEMPAARGSMCDEARSAIYQNTKSPQQLALCVCGPAPGVTVILAPPRVAPWWLSLQSTPGRREGSLTRSAPRYGCEMEKLGAMMGGPAFVEIGELLWTMQAMEIMTAPPPPSL
jgi:hypothetical protein